jgi:hypothetical protein
MNQPTYRILLCLLPLFFATGSHATPLQFNLGTFAPPLSTQAPNTPRDCTITYLIEDDAANQTYAQRMVFAPPAGAVPQHGVMPCPTLMSGRVAQAALDNCQEHAAHSGDCVFADMSRGFRNEPGISNTAENASRCASDEASHIGIACWRSGKMDICNVGCGNSAEAAITAARSRCALKHQKECSITGALPVAAR